MVATPSFSRSETVKSPVSSPSASAVRDWTLSSGASSAASALVEAKKTKEKTAAVAMILGVMSFFLGGWSRTDTTARRWQRTGEKSAFFEHPAFLQGVDGLNRWGHVRR